MKSPDRDAADEIERVARAICKADGYEPDSLSEPGERRNKLAWELYVHHAQEAVKASELATLRRRVEEMEKALILIGGYPHGSPLTVIGQIARAALAPLPPGRNEG